MVIYGNTISFGGGGGSNDTLPPLLDNFRANKGKHETVDFLSVPAGSTILLGKYKGKLVEEVLKTDPGYYSWIMNGDFPLNTKKILTEIKLRGFNSK